MAILSWLPFIWQVAGCTGTSESPFNAHEDFHLFCVLRLREKKWVIVSHNEVLVTLPI